MKPRKEAAELKPVTVAGTPADAISDFLPDPAGKYVIALSPTAGRYHVVTLGAAPAVKSLDAKGLVAGCLIALGLAAGGDPALGWGLAAAGTAASVTGEMAVLSGFADAAAGCPAPLGPGIVPPLDATQAANCAGETASIAIGM